MDRLSETESLGRLIHKKEAKKLKAKGQSPIAPMDNRPIGTGYHSRQVPKEQGSDEQLDNRLAKAERTRTQLKNFEIDEYLYQLINEGMIDERFTPFFAKACHQLGLATVNRLKINAMNGNDRQKLFAYKIKGALQLHYKRQFESE